MGLNRLIVSCSLNTGHLYSFYVMHINFTPAVAAEKKCLRTLQHRDLFELAKEQLNPYMHEYLSTKGKLNLQNDCSVPISTF